MSGSRRRAATMLTDVAVARHSKNSPTGDTIRESYVY